jgi:tetratricopeptide (TPR) repeat protein
MAISPLVISVTRFGRRVSWGTVAIAVMAAVVPTIAAERWVEVKSPNVTVMTTAGAGAGRALAWQLEQVRGAIKAVWPWARTDLNRPFVVIAVNNEDAMRALLPRYWEQRNAVRPTSVWVTAPDQHFLAIRSDLKAEGQAYINPHVSSYFSYVSLILSNSLEVDLPPWLSRGLAGILSNTIVEESQILVGAPIPWHLEQLRELARSRLTELVKMPRDAPQLATNEGLARFDAQSWALVHMLMFDKQGARAGALNQFFKLLASGTESQQAFRESLGRVEDLENDYVTYIGRDIFSFHRLKVDVNVKKDGFQQRELGAAEASSLRALFHTAMGRPIEARAAIAEARKADAAPETYVAEALLLEREGEKDEARGAFERATSTGSKSPYAHYRLATLRWGPAANTETLEEIEKLLSQAVALNNRYASGYAMLGEVRSLLGNTEAVGLVVRATQLEPAESNHRLIAARILMRQKRYDEALKAAQAAVALASTPEEASRARELQQAIERAK